MKTQDVINHFGGGAVGVQKLADTLGITRHAIYMWGDRVPRQRQFEIEVITAGALRVKRKGAR